MESARPKLIVLTPVRNEAWILPAFLKATSLWADHIIICDQMSIDGSREIYGKFPKVHVIDNNLKVMHMAATRRLLLNEARRLLNGDTNAILFAIDADEFIYGDFMLSEGWQTIINSKPHDCFCWRWMDMQLGSTSKYKLSPFLYFAVHVSQSLWDGYYPDVSIHEPRLPWATGTHEYLLSNFYSIHFAQINVKRRLNKTRFYQVSSVPDKQRYNTVNLYRQYHQDEYTECLELPNDAFVYYERYGLHIFEYLDLTDEGKHFTEVIKQNIQSYGVEKYAMIDIWDDDWCARNNISKPKRKVYQRLLMWYLEKSNPYAQSLIIRAIDKVLKKIIRLIVS